MRIEYLKIKNYLPVYNGTGLHDIEIDFTKSTNRIIMINASNGSGKTTLINLLHPLNDSNDVFIPGEVAYKEIWLSDKFTVYKIRHVHGIKSDGSRSTTKSYIKRCTNNIEEELNPNGNVSEFKEILFAELNLDANFLALTKLSSEDRGIVDKTPSERKKLINGILKDVDVFNNIHKALNKRSSIFKSFVNNINAKIDTIGDDSLLRSTVQSLENRINKYLKTKDEYITQLAEIKANINILDPNNELQNKKLYIDTELEDVDKVLIRLYKDLNNIGFKDYKEEDLNRELNELINTKSNIESSLNNIAYKESSIKELYQISSKELSEKLSKLDSMNVDENDNISSSYNDIIDRLDYIESIFTKIEYKKNNLTKDEFLSGMEIIRNIKESIRNIKSNFYLQTITNALDRIRYNDPIELKKYKEELDQLLILKDKKNKELVEYETLSSIASSLSNRPKNCKDDTCYYIRESLEAYNKLQLLNPNIQSELISIEEDINNLKSFIDTMTDVSNCISEFNSLLKWIKSNISILKKLPKMDNIVNIDKLIERFYDNDSFNEIDILYSYIEYCDLFDEYNMMINIKRELEVELEKNKEKYKFIDSIRMDIGNLRDKLKSYEEKLQSLSIESKEHSENALKSQIRIEEINKALLIYKDISIESKKKSDLLSEYNKLESSMENIKIYLNDLILIQGKIDEINKVVPYWVQDRDKINHQLNLLEEYNSELKIYRDKYDKVMGIKEGCNPTQDGVQLLFIDMYLHDTLAMTNDLLKMIFNGKYQIQKYSVLDDEFKIPIIGEGYPRDDISSLSSSEKSIISMIVSFVLLRQSSTKYNILRLDELDGALDQYNRSIFIDLLNRMLDLLEVEQCIIISHNSELDKNDVDLILLNDPNNSYMSNVIYSTH